MNTHNITLPKKDSTKSAYLHVFVLLLTTVQIIFLIWRFSSWYYDDPFITYRYAWNLIHGLGFVYNPGERVLSTTTPFFTLLLAGIGIIWSNLPRIATLAGCISAGMSGLIFWDLARQWKQDIAGWVGLLLIPNFPILTSTISSETPLYIALVLGTLDSYVRRRYKLTAVTAAVLILVRPDGALLPLLIAAHFLVNKKRGIPWSAVGIFILINAIWCGFAWYYFGSPFPMTLLTKQQQGLMSISQQFAPGLITIAAPYAQHWYYVVEAILALVGFIWLVIHRHSATMLVLWTMLYFLAYSLLGVARYFWYYAPLVPGFIVMVGAGFRFIYEWGKQTNWLRLSNLQIERGLTIFLAILWIFQGIHTYNFSQTPDLRYNQYWSIGEWLNKNSQVSDRIGTLEVGIIGYFADRPIVDFAGLIQPEVAKQMRADSTYEDTARWAINNYHPAYIALNPAGFPHLVEDYVKNQCYPVQYFNAEDFQSDRDMVIYHCEQVISGSIK